MSNKAFEVPGHPGFRVKYDRCRDFLDPNTNAVAVEECLVFTTWTSNEIGNIAHNATAMEIMLIQIGLGDRPRYTTVVDFHGMVIRSEVWCPSNTWERMFPPQPKKPRAKRERKRAETSVPVFDGELDLRDIS